MTDLIRAPWTSEQVAALEQFQTVSNMHPFTCGADHHTLAPRLIPSHSGWYCPDPDCDYQQDWAHAFMADPARWPRSPFGERHGPTPQEVASSLYTVDGPAVTAMTVPPFRLVIDGAHGPLVTIHLDDGRLEYGPGYTPDEAARRFWDAVSKHTPELKEGQS